MEDLLLIYVIYLFVALFSIVFANPKSNAMTDEFSQMMIQPNQCKVHSKNFVCCFSLYFIGRVVRQRAV